MKKQTKKVVIIGAGPSGLLTARYAIQLGFQPVILQKSAGIGGVWNPETGAVWKQMTTNQSKYTCSFSDFPWPQSAPLYPSSTQVMQYLTNYCNYFKLNSYIIFNAEVTHLRKQKDNTYHITYEKDSKQHEIKFQRVVISSGIFSLPFIPSIPGMETFQGKIMHSKNYRNGRDYEGKNILVIGGSLTAVQIASNVSQYASKVIHSFNKPFWVLPLFIGPKNNKMPGDYFYSRQFYIKQPAENPYLVKNSQYSKSTCSYQYEVKQLSIDQQQFKKPIYISFSKDYVQNCKLKRVKPIKSEVTKIDNKSIHLNLKQFSGKQDQSYKQKQKQKQKLILEDIDLIILCTGYKSGLDYLSQEIKQIIQYQENNILQPIVLFKQMYHPIINNLFFIGLYKGSFFAVMEQQARVAIRYFAGLISLPSQQQIQKGLLQQKNIRMERKQFPHSDYVKFCDQIAKIAGNKMQIQQMANKIKKGNNESDKNQNNELIQKFFRMPVFPCVKNAFTTQNIQGQIEETQKIIQNADKQRKINAQ